VTAGEDVTAYFRKLPEYSKGLKEYIPEEDLWFYEDQMEDRPNTRGSNGAGIRREL
jgi:hypothetical protein